VILAVEQLAAAVQCPAARAQKWVDAINAACAKYEINTPLRMASFLAQVAHESGGLVYVREIWGPTPVQQRYEGRADLGNTVKGDGFRYRGRGLLQVTGRYNYRILGKKLGLPLEDNPELLELPEHGAMASALYWFEHGLNVIADSGDQIGVSKGVNCGSPKSKVTPNGLRDRLSRFEVCKKVLC
jgi:putative chitinase